jgi:hypothetical protein
VGLHDDPATITLDDTDDSDFLNGGGGGDLILAGQGDLVDSGPGDDTVMIGDWITEGQPVQIFDFHPEEDRLVVFYDSEVGDAPALRLEPDGDAALALLLNGVQIATVGNAAGLTLDHIALLPREALPAIRGL